MRLIYNTQTRANLDKIISDLPQALLISGDVGSGLLTTAKYIAGASLIDIIQPTDTDGNTNLGTRGIIRIAQIKQLQQDVRGKSTKTRVIIIDNADTMNKQSQNSFLKLLEEPNQNIKFILTSHRHDKLLATVLSRLQIIKILPISNSDSRMLINNLDIKDERKVQQLLFIASGRPAEIFRLASDDAYFKTKAEIMSTARDFLGNDTNNKIKIVAQIANNREQALELINACKSIMKYNIHNNVSVSKIALASKLADTYDYISANGNVRLHLLNFVIN